MTGGAHAPLSWRLVGTGQALPLVGDLRRDAAGSALYAATLDGGVYRLAPAP